MISFIEGEPISGRVIYRRSEWSFDVDPHPPSGGVCSLLVNDVQIEIDDDGYLMYVWGVCPHESWGVDSLAPPNWRRGKLRFTGEEVVPGVSLQMNRDTRWPVSYDPASGWLCIGNATAAGESVGFGPGAVATLDAHQLVALWLQPRMDP